MAAFRAYFDHESPSGEVLELCAVLSADGDVVRFDMWDSGRGWVLGKPWVPLPDDRGLDMDDLRDASVVERARAKGAV